MSYRRSATLLVLAALAPLGIAHAATAPAQETISTLNGLMNPTECDKLFKLPTGTIQMTADQHIMNQKVCAAYQYLITKYPIVGNCAKVKIDGDPRVVGITSLNPNLALQLAAMMKTADTNNVSLIITSPFRRLEGEACAAHDANGNALYPNSKHIKGLAVDLGYGQSDSGHDCSSATYKWVFANDTKYGLALFSQNHPGSTLGGECNHLEYTGPGNTDPGPGVTKTTTTAPAATHTSTETIDPTDGHGTILITAPAHTTSNPIINNDNQLLNSIKSLFGAKTSTQSSQTSLPVVQTTTQTPIQYPTQTQSSTQVATSSVATGYGNLTSNTTTTSSASSQTQDATSTDTPRVTVSSGPAKTIAELIDALSQPAPTLPATTTPAPTIALNTQPTNILTTLFPRGQATTAPTSTSSMSGVTRQTSFTSSDLSGATQTGFTPGQASFFMTSLTTLKDSLLKILDRLNPFKSTETTPSAQAAEPTTLPATASSTPSNTESE